MILQREKMKLMDPDGASNVKAFWSEDSEKVETRLIAVSKAPCVSGPTIIFKTDAPEEYLERLEKLSHKNYRKEGKGINWVDAIRKKSYRIEAVDVYSEDFLKPSDWLKEKYPEIQEFYSLRGSENE